MENNNGPQLATRELTEEDIHRKRIQLEHAKMNKDDTDLQLKEMEAQLEKKIPARLLDDSIAELKQDIKDKVIRRNKGGNETIEEATEADLDLLGVKLNTLIGMKKADLPMRDLRSQIAILRERKSAVDAPEQQIKKLEKEIRERKETTLASRVNRPTLPTGVG